MKPSVILLAAAALFTPAVCAVAQDSKDAPKTATAVFTVSPKMTCQNCENKIKTNIRFEKGVNDIRTNLKDQTVTIQYNPRTTDTQRITEAFKKIGYTATEVQPQGDTSNNQK